MGLPLHKELNKQIIHYTVEAMLEGLRTSNNEVLSFIYRQYYPEIRFFVIKNSGSDEDAQDVFQESIIIIYKKLRDDVLKLSCSFKTYLYSVCRIVWLKQLEKRKTKTDSLSYNQAFVDLQEGIGEMAEEQERFKLYQKHFQTLHEDCQMILKLFFEKKSHKEIASKMNITSENYLKKRKYQCKEILVKRIQNDPDFKRIKNDRL